MANHAKYFAAQDDAQQSNYERQYLYLLESVRGGVVIHERDINRMQSMTRDEIIAMLSSMPRVREQPMPM